MNDKTDLSKELFNVLHHVDEPICICPKYDKTFRILGKKWTALIVDVLSHKESRFTTISRIIDEISDRVLTERLKELEQEAIVEKYASEDNPTWFIYRLTEKGRALADATQALKEWSEKWID